MFQVSAPFAGRLTVTWEGTGLGPSNSEVREAVVATGLHTANSVRSVQYASAAASKGTRYLRWFVYVSR